MSQVFSWVVDKTMLKACGVSEKGMYEMVLSEKFKIYFSKKQAHLFK